MKPRVGAGASRGCAPTTVDGGQALQGAAGMLDSSARFNSVDRCANRLEG